MFEFLGHRKENGKRVNDDKYVISHLFNLYFNKNRLMNSVSSFFNKQLQCI